LYFGDMRITFEELFRMLSLGPYAEAEEAIRYDLVWRIRLPRVLASTLSGAVLASCGVIFQAVLRNPLAEPYTLGVASGAAFGAAVAIAAGVPAVTSAAFAGSIAALFVVWVLGDRKNDADISRIVLAGVIVGSVLGAGLTMLKALAGDRVLSIVAWLMGSFASARGSDIFPLSNALSIMLLLFILFARELDIMASGTDGASLGMNVPRTRAILLGGSSLAASLVVSRFGVIGFVGLVIPHLVRLLFGPSHLVLFPLSLTGGAALLCAADTLAKGWNELPVGVLTALIGGPIFCFILWNRK
jgi:iron complex transport system permease protein